MPTTILISDPVHGFVNVPQGLLCDVLHHRYVQRLRYVKQLGLTHLVYPGACHTRFSHALGAMHLMSKAIASLRRKGTTITDAEETAAQCAMLLHDIGHSPYSHALEFRIFTGVAHEDISLAMMRQMNSELHGALSLAIDIFENRYHKRFLHQLISSQLDMDRLDYLARDAFFTGVAEGAVGVPRIIQMLNSVNNELVVEEKGIHSVEQFLIARRQMYWQVYMHKTVVSAEQLVLAAVRRMVFLLNNVKSLPISEPLAFFLKNKLSKNDINDSTLGVFARLTDGSADCAIAACAEHEDDILRTLCSAFVQRTLPMIEVADIPFDDAKVQTCMALVAAGQGAAEYFVSSGRLCNSAYSLAGDGISIRSRSGDVRNIATASDMLDATAFLHDRVKYFLCWSGGAL